MWIQLLVSFLEERDVDTIPTAKGMQTHTGGKAVQGWR